MFVFLKCPVTCGGGVRSRTVTCALEPKKTCDLSTKPRSRSLCALQSCPSSGLNRRPGLPPVYRRIYPPKPHPTKHPGAPSWASTAAPTKAFISTTRSQYSPETTTPEIINADDYKFNVVIRKIYSTKPNSAKKERKNTIVKEENLEDGEEGSTPNMWMNPPGFDYVVEDRIKGREKINDLNFFTSVMSRTSQTATPTPETYPFTMTTAAHRPSLISTQTWAKTNHYLSNPHMKSNTGPSSLWTHRVPLTTPMKPRKPPTTAAPPQPPQPVRKLKKSTVTIKKNNPKQPPSTSKGSQSKSQNQQPRSSKSSSTSDQSNLMAREPVSRDISWVAGNWSEVGNNVLSSYQPTRKIIKANAWLLPTTMKVQVQNISCCTKTKNHLHKHKIDHKYS